MQSTVLDPLNIRDIAPLVLDKSGRLTVVPASVYEQTTSAERALLCLRQGLYSLPTVELVTYLRDVIAGRPAIEIGAGPGTLADALGIPATDNRQQDEPAIRAYYTALNQPTVPYGPTVEKLDAAEALKKHKPKVVVACWVTHRYRPERHAAGGNETGVNEEAVIAGCDAYIFIGNERVHAAKSIWSLPHEKLTPPWLYSRAMNGSADFIAIWRRPGAAPGPVT